MEAKKNDIFISYARKDKSSAINLALALKKNGWSVWWDNEILAGKTFRKTIERQLKNSKCVIVLWSNNSINSDFVNDEADFGKNMNILIPVLIEDCEIPLGFRQIQTHRMHDIHSKLNISELDHLFSAITNMLNPDIHITYKNSKNKDIQNTIASELLKKSSRKWPQIIFAPALFIGLVVSILALYLTWPAAFEINNQALKFTDPIIIKAGNFIANKPVHLNVQFDEKFYEKQAILQKKSKDRQIWHFWIKDQHYSPDMIKAGKHTIRVGFPDDRMSEEFVIEFMPHIPRFIILTPTLRSDGIMKIMADNNIANIKKSLHIEFDSVLFPESGVPVDIKGQQIWHCNLQNLQLTPEIIKKGKHKIRFRFPGGEFSKEHAIVIKPLLGSLYVTTKPEKAKIYLNGKKKGKSPANFKNIASGFVDILVELDNYKKQKKSLHIHPEKQNSVHFDLEKIILNINVVTNPSGANIFVNGKQKGFSPVTLTNITPGDYELKAVLTDYLENIKYIKLKDKDKKIIINLIKKGIIAKKYRLRSIPKLLSTQELYKLTDSNFKPKSYIENHYVDNGDGTVTDYATDLVWQKKGSNTIISYDKAKKYIYRLNKEKFGGYSDWRLPTLEELISLLEKEELNKHLYIYPVFNRYQAWCWSADIWSYKGAYSLHYGYKSVWTTEESFVRAVRSFRQ